MDLEHISIDIMEHIFKKHATKIKVFLKSSNTKGSNYDPYRNVGYVETFQSPIWVDAMISTVSPNSLIIRQLGLVETGAKKIVVSNKNASLIRLSNKILIDEKEYYTRNDKTGNKVQEFELPTRFTRFIVFRKNS